MTINPLHTREPVIIPDRPAPTKAMKVSAWNRENGLCVLCGKPVAQTGEGVQYDHMIARALSADDSVENLFATHPKCHGMKTRDDIGRIAKARRQNKLTRPKEIKAGGFRAWRKFDGSIVRRGRS